MYIHDTCVDRYTYTSPHRYFGIESSCGWCGGRGGGERVRYCRGVKAWIAGRRGGGQEEEVAEEVAGGEGRGGKGEGEAVGDEEEGGGVEAAKPTALTDMIPPGHPEP